MRESFLRNPWGHHDLATTHLRPTTIAVTKVRVRPIVVRMSVVRVTSVFHVAQLTLLLQACNLSCLAILAVTRLLLGANATILTDVAELNGNSLRNARLLHGYPIQRRGGRHRLRSQGSERGRWRRVRRPASLAVRQFAVSQSDRSRAATVTSSLAAGCGHFGM